MNDQDLRFECLKLATQAGERGAEAVQSAQSFLQFVKGEAPGKSASLKAPTNRKRPTS